MRFPVAAGSSYRDERRMMSEYKCSGVKADWSSEKRGLFYEPVSDEWADAWEVCEIASDGTELWVANFETRELAEEYRKFKSANYVRYSENEPPCCRCLELLKTLKVIMDWQCNKMCTVPRDECDQERCNDEHNFDFTNARQLIADYEKRE